MLDSAERLELCFIKLLLSSVQQLSHVRFFLTPWTEAHQASLSINNPQSLLKLMSIELVMSSNHLILCHPLLLLPSIFQSIRVISNESVLHMRWPKYRSFSFSISPSKEYSGLISFRIDWLDLLAVQGTFKSLLPYHSSKASSLQHSAFFRRRQWQPTPVLLPGKSHGRRSLVGCCPWGRQESDRTDQLHFDFSLLCIGEGNGVVQCSCLENPRDRGACWATVYGVAQSWTRLK